MSNGKLFEVLAVETEAQSRADKLINETLSTFKNKEGLFKGKVRSLTLFDQSPERAVEVAAIEAKDSIETKVTATVPGNLSYLANIISDYWDVMYQKEATNQVAKADVIVDGVALLKDVPVTFLLCMESRLKSLRTVFEEIPTLAPGVPWVKDAAYGAHIYASPQTSDIKTREDTEYRIVAPATDKHPAQVVPIKGQFNIGKYSNTEWSGLISSAEKAELLTRFDKLARAIKKARQRANDVTAVNTKVGDVMVKALLGSWFNRSNTN